MGGKGTSERASALPLVTVWVVALLVFGYSCARAAELAFTHDESYSYLHWSRQPLVDILLYEHGADANNHLLNTLALKVVAKFGDSPFVLRLPILLMHAAWLWGAARVTRLMTTEATWPFAFALLVCNPFVLDYFAVARGYGYGLAFMIWGLNAALRVCADARGERRRALAFGLCMVGASVSCFVFALVACASLAALIIVESLKAGSLRQALVDQRPVFAAYGAFAVLCTPMVIKVARDESNFGTTLGFWSGTVASLVERSLYGLVQGDTTLAGVLLAAFGLLLALIALITKNRGARAPKARRRLAFLLLLIVFAGFGAGLQSLVTGTLALFERTAIFFLPLYALVLVATLADFGAGRLRSIARTVLCVFGIGLGVHLASSAQLRTMASGEWESEVPAMLDRLDQARDPSQEHVRLAIEQIFEPNVNYYREQRGYRWLAKVTRDGLRGGDFDFYYFTSVLEKDERPDVRTDVLARFAQSRTELHQPRKR